MQYKRSPIEIESPEEIGFDSIDNNLAESSVSDVALDDLRFDLSDLRLAYSDHRGKIELRELIADSSPDIDPDDVLLTMGAAGALFMVATSVLEAGSHVVIASPNYVTNVDTPRTIGCDVDLLTLRFDEEFGVDIDRLAELIRPTTRLVSLTTPHNPTGAVMSRRDLGAVIDLVESSSAYLLLDETYRDLTFGDRLPTAASLSTRAISISSVSKAFGLPGLRTGWLVCRDASLMETLLAAKEQIHICNPVVTEELTYAFMRERDPRMEDLRAGIRQSFEIVRRWMSNEARLEWIEPRGGVVCFPRVKPDIDIDIDRFYETLLNTHRTAVGPGHWFEFDRRHMRIGFAWPDTVELQRGLATISQTLDTTCTRS